MRGPGLRSRAQPWVTALLLFAAGCATSQDASAPAATARPDAPAVSGPGTSAVERSFDEQRQVYLVRATFGLSTGIELRMTSEPQRSLTRIAVAVTGSSREPAPRECRALQLLINAQPVSAEDAATPPADGRFQIDGAFHFDHFKALAQGSATFGVRACEDAWQLSSEQVTELKKFLGFHTDLAAQVQRGELPERTDPTVPDPDGT